MRAGFRVDKLGCNAYSIAGFAYATFEQVADTELASNLLHVDSLASVGKARISGDYEEPFDARKAGNNVFDYAICEVFLLRVGAHILEREDGDRRPVREIGILIRPLDCGRPELWLFADLADEPETLAENGTDEPLVFAVVA